MGLYLWLLSGTALADVAALPVETGQPSATATDLPTTALAIGNEVLTVLALLAGIAAIFYLILAGFQYLTSAGNPEKIKAGRGGVINAVIGIIVIVGAYEGVRLAIGIGSAINK